MGVCVLNLWTEVLFIVSRRAGNLNGREPEVKGPNRPLNALNRPFKWINRTLIALIKPALNAVP